MRTISVFVVGLLLAVVLGGAPVSAYNGIELSYASVGNFTLVDQNNSEYKLSDATEENVVESFYFTR